MVRKIRKLWESLIEMYSGKIPITEEGKLILEELKEISETKCVKLNCDESYSLLLRFINPAFDPRIIAFELTEKRTKEVYENEIEFYFRTWGLRIPYEEFSFWFLFRYMLRHPQWMIENLNYKNIAIDFNKFYAKSRIKREREQALHYHLLNSESLPLDLAETINVEMPIKKNLFNNMPIVEVEKWFAKLANNKSINGRPFLSASNVKLFIDRAFCKETGIEKLTLNYGPKEKLFVWKLFYQYYLNCISIEDGVERGSQCRDKYIRLLTDNFTNFTFDEVKANFAKSNSISQDWN